MRSAGFSPRALLARHGRVSLMVDDVNAAAPSGLPAAGVRAQACGGDKDTGRIKPGERGGRTMHSEGMMSAFVPGLELSRAYYHDVLRPLLDDVPHSSALIGPGSEVLGFDTARSADHDWGPVR